MRLRPLRVESLEDRTTPSTLPAGFTESTLVAGLNQPTSLVVAPDGRLFVAEQGGALRIVQSGALVATPALSLPVDSSGERGLLGVALDPFFTTSGFVYLYYTQASGNMHRVSRFSMTGNTINIGSEVVLLSIPDSPGTSNHNGGALRFGPNGKLFITTGDDGLGSNAQSLNNLHGKILRINPDGSIPEDNPFFNTTTGDNRAIWALGLRNPFTFDIQPVTGRMMINDVGQVSFEEVNLGTPGHNYGWPATEGDFNPTTFPDFTPPVFAYPHTSGTAGGYAITGAAFYPTTGGSFPMDYAGDYFFGDLANNWIRRYDPASGQVTLFASNLPNSLVDLDVPADGSLLLLSHDGLITRIAAPPVPQAPTITLPPASTTILKTQGTTFFATATGTGPLTYQWQRDTVNIPGATQPTFTIGHAELTDSGASFRVVVTNSSGTAISSAATLTVQDVTPPAPGPVLIGSAQIGTGLDSGGPNQASLLNADHSVRFSVAPYEAGFSGGIRTAAADFNADGIADLVVASGPGRTGNARIYDGKDQTVLFDISPFGAAFTRGINVSAGDLNNDGRADLVISAERGGGARIRIFNSTPTGFVQRSDFFGLIGGDDQPDTNFRGGARTTVGDFDGDGVGDLVFAAGAGGGPRIAIFGGVGLGANGGPKLRGDFFAFEPNLRDGTFVAAGDFDGDGNAELAAGAGPGGAPRVTLFLGSALIAGQTIRWRDFFAGDTTGRGGVRVAVKNLNGDARADLVTGRDDGTIQTFDGAAFADGVAPGTPFTALPGFSDAVFVG